MPIHCLLWSGQVFYVDTTFSVLLKSCHFRTQVLKIDFWEKLSFLTGLLVIPTDKLSVLT